MERSTWRHHFTCVDILSITKVSEGFLRARGQLAVNWSKHHSPPLTITTDVQNSFTESEGSKHNVEKSWGQSVWMYEVFDRDMLALELKSDEFKVIFVLDWWYVQVLCPHVSCCIDDQLKCSERKPNVKSHTVHKASRKTYWLDSNWWGWFGLCLKTWVTEMKTWNFFLFKG